MSPVKTISIIAIGSKAINVRSFFSSLFFITITSLFILLNCSIDLLRKFIQCLTAIFDAVYLLLVEYIAFQ